MRPSKDAILNELDTLKKYKNLVVVEGEHDRDALERLGLERIFILNKTGVSIFNRIEELIGQLKYKESCVILTDLDKKGKTYYKLIKKELENRGMRTNRRLREILTKTRVSHIEGLATFLSDREID
ncbi:hypothetical protein ACFLZZ_04340 [Nanoarchaeota archaeon]